MSRYEDIKIKRVDLFDVDEEEDWNYLINIIEQMIKLINIIPNCSCDSAYLNRKLIDPNCTKCHLEPELSKALKLLEKD